MPQQDTNKLDLKTFILIFTLAAQIGAWVWFFSNLNSRVNNLEAWREQNTQIIANLPRLEERIDAMCKGIGRLEVKLDAIEQRFWAKGGLKP